jgi:hypothetical protein
MHSFADRVTSTPLEGDMFWVHDPSESPEAVTAALAEFVRTGKRESSKHPTIRVDMGLPTLTFDLLKLARAAGGYTRGSGTELTICSLRLGVFTAFIVCVEAITKKSATIVCSFKVITCY